MKLAIFSDLHLTNSLPYTVVGDSFRKQRLIEYISKFFQEIEEETVDFLILPGDICHNTLLNPDDIDLLLYLFRKITESGIRTIICLGNHDIDQDKNVLSFLKRKTKHLYPNIFYSEKTAYTYIFEGVVFDVINYCSHHFFLKKAFSLGKVQPREKFSVLVGHIGVKGTLHGTTKSIIGVKKKDIERLSEYYDLIILGHHHKFQWVTNKCIYPGAIQQTRIDERHTIPGGLIISLPHLDIIHIENTFSPRFKIIDNYAVVPEDIFRSIVKPVVDTESVSESENISFLKEIAAQEPYYLIKPRLKKTFSITDGEHKYSVNNKRIALLKTMKEFDLEKKKAKSFYEHTINLWEEVKGGQTNDK